MVSLKGILNMDFRYPGIEIKVELIVLQAYLSQIENGVKSACEGYISEEMKNYTSSEYHEYQHVYQIAEDEMPRIIRIPFIVTIYAIFENSVARLLDYAKLKEEKDLSLKDINGKSPISTQNKYMKHVLGYEYQFSNKIIEDIGQINTVRNYMAHCNGNIRSLSEEKINKLKSISGKVVGLSIESDVIDISYQYLENSMNTVESSLRELMSYMESRYGFY
ncbi:hypothetical protein [Methylomonas methanica]|uniref:Cthe-2314-like HEPN domain-containing protein n=1 Tax=Methylomonas methanica (strain DSM 25384 / MC09) TaxID=857087 RepID=G0A6Z2_METMM|nr:hypothetical protein [Methylomonas methanica]AEG01786.1 hypothetical protein Metme_3416 [Methylomonas methanica MC09]